MKKIMMFAMTVASSLAFAEGPSINHIPLNENTTISVKKGSGAENVFEVVDGQADVAGDPDILLVKARSSWKKACEDWKKELKEMNRENQLIAANCGPMSCVKNGMTETLCSSKAHYKVKTKIK